MLYPQAFFLHPGHIFQYAGALRVCVEAAKDSYSLRQPTNLVLPEVQKITPPVLCMDIVCIQTLVLSLLHSGQKGHRMLSQHENVSSQHWGSMASLNFDLRTFVLFQLILYTHAFRQNGTWNVPLMAKRIWKTELVAAMDLPLSSVNKSHCRCE